MGVRVVRHRVRMPATALGGHGDFCARWSLWEDRGERAARNVRSATCVSGRFVPSVFCGARPDTTIFPLPVNTGPVCILRFYFPSDFSSRRTGSMTFPIFPFAPRGRAGERAGGAAPPRSPPLGWPSLARPPHLARDIFLALHLFFDFQGLLEHGWRTFGGLLEDGWMIGGLLPHPQWGSGSPRNFLAWILASTLFDTCCDGFRCLASICLSTPTGLEAFWSVTGLLVIAVELSPSNSVY